MYQLNKFKMKNRFLFLLLTIICFDGLSQSIVLTPSSLESKNNIYESISLKGVATPNLIGYRHGGTLVNPSNTSDGNILMSLEGRGFANNNFTSFNSGLRFKATQDWTANNQGTSAEIFTSQNGSTLATSRLFINHNGKIGVGNYLITTPSHQLEVQQPDGEDRGLGVFRFGGNAPSLFGIGARGSNIIPFATQTGDILARFGGKGHTGVDYSTAKSRIDMVAIEDWNASENGSEMRFFTTPINQSELSQSLTIRGNGNVGIGEVAPQSKLVINGDYQLNKVKTITAGGITINSFNREGASVIYVDACDYIPTEFGCIFDPGSQIGNAYNVTLAGIDAAQTGVVVHIIVGDHPSFPVTLTIDGNASTACNGCKLFTNSGGGDGNFNLTKYQSATFVYLTPASGHSGWYMLNKSN